MSTSQKIKKFSKFKEKRDGLLKQVEEMQKRIKELEKKRKLEIGELAIESGLADIEDDILKTAFEKIAHENSAAA